MADSRNPQTQQILNALGTRNAVSMTTDYYFVYGDWARNIAQNGNGNINVKIDGGVDFVVEQIQLMGFLAAGNLPTGVTVERLPLIRARSWDFTAAANQGLVGYLDHVNIQIQTNDRPWFFQPTPATLVTGDRDQPYYLPTQVFISGNDTTLIQIGNVLPALTGLAAPAIDVFCALVGRKLGRSPSN